MSDPIKKFRSLRLRYNDTGVLKGHVPSGHYLTIYHKQPGQSGFEVFWAGKLYKWFHEGLVAEEFGIEVHLKKSGAQKGHPSEAAQRSIWRYFVDRFNSGDTSVQYSP